MRRWLIVPITAVLVAADQIVKYFAIQYLEPIGSYPLLDGFLQLTYVENTGAAFGSFSRYTTLLSIFTAVVLLFGFAVLLSGKVRSKFVYVSCTLILSGGLGNLIDRVARSYVVDYIEPLFVNFAVFNFADMLVCVGAGLLIGYLLYDMVREQRQRPKNGETQNHESD